MLGGFFKSFSSHILNALPRSHSEVISNVHITPNLLPYSKVNGLAIYAPPGSGKTKYNDEVILRSIDTDNVYAPELQSNKAMADRGFIVFTNEYFNVIPLIPTIMFIPRDDIIIAKNG
jgi:hypothetical protein